ncbi:hypothetical protein GCM10027443_15980 [Pontibacter brevis]
MALLRHTLRTIKKSGIPFLTVFTEQQSGSTFGERLANAFRDAFQAGYQRVICVGSDCPTLTAADLLQAKHVLQERCIVAGPAADGGAWLTGMHADNFNPEAFALLNWQTDQVMQELASYAFQQGVPLHALGFLQVKADVDSGEDLNLLLQQLPVLNRLRKQLLSILSKGAAQARAFRRLLIQPFDKHLQVLLLRPPPLQQL